MALRTTNFGRREVWTGDALAAGPITVAAYQALVDADVCISMGDAGGFGRRDRGPDLAIAGEDAESTEIVLNVWAVEGVDGEDDTTPESYMLFLLGTVTVVLGSTEGPAGMTIDDSMRYADEMTWTAAPYGTLCRLKGNAQNLTCEPGDGAPAILSLGDVNNALAVIVEVDSGATGDVAVLRKVGT